MREQCDGNAKAMHAMHGHCGGTAEAMQEQCQGAISPTGTTSRGVVPNLVLLPGEYFQIWCELRIDCSKSGMAMLSHYTG